MTYINQIRLGCHHTDSRRLKEDVWKPIANEIGVPWRAAEAMHWHIGEGEMARRANVTPFSITAAQNEQAAAGGGRIAQRDRMQQSMKVFEGQNLGNLNSSFVPVDAHYGHETGFAVPGGAAPGTLPYPGMPSPRYVHIAPLRNEPPAPEYDEGIQADDEGGHGSGTTRVKKERKASETRLPGFAELDGNMQAVAEGRDYQTAGHDWVMVKREGASEHDRRRSSGESHGSQ